MSPIIVMLAIVSQAATGTAAEPGEPAGWCWSPGGDTAAMGPPPTGPS